MSARPPILVITGVTGAGKTAAAVTVAERMGGELIGADSVQVVRGFDIGSAKPTADELRGVRHHLIDVADPDEPIDAARFASLADAAITDVASRGARPIVVGGTGLWLRALLRGLVELPEPDPGLRAALEAEADERGLAAMHTRLREVDPRLGARLHENDRLRVLRALEVHAQTGEALGALQHAHALGGPRYSAEVYVLDRPRDELYPALKARIRAMLEAGWVPEVRALLERWGPEVRAMNSVGYRQVAAHVAEGVALEETERLAYKATRIYTRRQRTWLRGAHGDSAWTTAEQLPALLGASA